MPGLHDLQLVQVRNRITRQPSFNRLAHAFTLKLDSPYSIIKMRVKLLVNQFVLINVSYKLFIHEFKFVTSPLLLIQHKVCPRSKYCHASILDIYSIFTCVTLPCTVLSRSLRYTVQHCSVSQ